MYLTAVLLSLPDALARSALRPILALRFPKGLVVVLISGLPRGRSKSECLKCGALRASVEKTSDGRRHKMAWEAAELEKIIMRVYLMVQHSQHYHTSQSEYRYA